MREIPDSCYNWFRNLASDPAHDQLYAIYHIPRTSRFTLSTYVLSPTSVLSSTEPLTPSAGVLCDGDVHRKLGVRQQSGHL
ncbi:MAG: hypothetical protein KatS3mg057_1262 [Herpetosiphonaceae bacterium]|nr:MAG: hypothetical protein KatS3mg057_1262 [Herpetosiphonaceae bacterium]